MSGTCQVYLCPGLHRCNNLIEDAKTQGQTIVKMAENLTSGKDAVDGIEGVETEEEAKAVRVPYQAITKDNLDLAKSTYE